MENNQFDLKELSRKAAEVFEVNVDDIYSTKRQRHIVDCRRAIFYLLKTYYGKSELTISRLTGKSRDHSTIIYNNDTTSDLLESDYRFANKYKLFFEYQTKIQYTKPLPIKRDLWEKKKIIYRYYTDDMIARSKIAIKAKVEMLSDGYKEKVVDFIRKTPNISKAQEQFGVSKKLLTYILAESVAL